MGVCLTAAHKVTRKLRAIAVLMEHRWWTKQNGNEAFNEFASLQRRDRSWSIDPDVKFDGKHAKTY